MMSIKALVVVAFISTLTISSAQTQTDITPSTAILFSVVCENSATGVVVSCPTYAGAENNQGASIFGVGGGSTDFGNIGGTIILLPTPAPTQAPISSTASPTRSPSETNDTASPTMSPGSSSPSASPVRVPTASPIISPKCTLGLCAQCSSTKLYNPATGKLIQGCGFETSNDTRIDELANVTAGGCLLSLNLGEQSVIENGQTVIVNVTMCLSEPIACGISDDMTNTTSYDESVCPIDGPDECGNNTGVIIIIVVCVLLLLVVIAIGVYYVIWTSNNHKGPNKMEIK